MTCSVQLKENCIIMRKDEIMKKIFLLFLALAGSLFFSCSFLDSESEKSDEQKLQKSYEFFGSIKTPSAKSSSSNLVSSKSSQIARTIMPEFQTSNLTFSVYGKKSGSSARLEPKSIDALTGDYSVVISEDGSYVFYAEVSDSSGKLLYSGETDSLEISNGKITVSGSETETIPPIQAKPAKSGKGNAEIQVDLTSATQIGCVKAEWKLDSAASAATFTKTITSESDRSFSLYLSDSSNTETSITSGTYTFSLYFYNNSAEQMELYRITNEVVQVYDNFTSNVYVGNASYFRNGKITVTSSVISGTAYVAGTSPSKLAANSSGANGTYYAPFSSISDALAKVEASGSDTMTIYLDGTFDRSADGVLAISVSSGTLNINGLNGAENSVLTSSSGYGISVSSGSKVNLKDITVKNCAGGILNDGTLSLSGAVISGNTSSGNGGGVCNNSSLSVSDGTKISGNKASNGGGIYMGSGAGLSLGGNVEISGNTKSSDETVSDNLSLGTSAVTVSSALSGTIGISLQTAISVGQSQVLTSGFTSYNSESDAANIFSCDDSASYSIATQNNEVIISKSSVVWISSSGNDTNKGTYDSPLKTFSAAYKIFNDAGALSSSANIIKIKDTLTPEAGLNSDSYEITATIQGATGDDKTGKATIDLKDIKNGSENTSGFYVGAAQNLTFKNLLFTTSGTNFASVYGAIFVKNTSANVKIEDCDFTGINANGACSAIVLDSGNLTLKDVSVTQNKATLASGGVRTYAVEFEGGTLTLSGKVTVSGNTQPDGTTAGNLYVGKGLKLDLASDFDSESKICFSTEDTPESSAVTFATGYILPAAPSGIFTDDDGYLVAQDSTTSSNLVIKTSGSGSVNISTPGLTFAADLSGSTYTITATSFGSEVATSVTAWNVKVAANGVDITDAAGFKVTAAEGSKPTVVLPDGLVSGTYTIEVSGTYAGTVYSGSIEFKK